MGSGEIELSEALIQGKYDREFQLRHDTPPVCPQPNATGALAGMTYFPYFRT